MDKLANEFPPENVTDECSHPGFACLRVCNNRDKSVFEFEYFSRELQIKYK